MCRTEKYSKWLQLSSLLQVDNTSSSVSPFRRIYTGAHIINKNILHADLPHNAWEKQTHSFRCKRPTVLLIFNLLICREQTGHLELHSISEEVYVNITCFLTFCRKVTHDYDCMCSKTQSVSTLIHDENYLKCYFINHII